MTVHRLLSELPSVRSLGAMTPSERRQTMSEVMSKLADASDQITNRANAAGRALLASEQRDADELTDAGRRYEEADRALRLGEQEAAEHRTRAATPTSPLTYRAGIPLGEGQTFTGYARSRGLTSELEQREPLDLGKYATGLLTGNWRDAEPERRAMVEGTTTAGGFLVPTMLSAQIIDLARAKTAVAKVGALTVPMESRTLDIGKWTGDPTAAWRSESAQITASDPTVGKITLTAQSLASYVVASREVLEDVPSLAGKLTEAFAAAFALKLDLAALRGTGTAPEPRGIKNTSGITATVLGTGAGAALTWDHLIDGVGVLTDADEAVSGIVYHPRSGRSLAKAKDQNLAYLAPPAAMANIPRAESTQLPINLTLTTSTDCSEIYIGDFRQLIIGVRTQLMVQPLVERLADYGQIAFLAWMRAEVAVARPAAFNLLTGVRP